MKLIERLILLGVFARKVQFYAFITIVSIVLFSLLSHADSVCYQENANESTACGGLATGSITISANWSNTGNITDGNWTTYGTTDGVGGAYMDVDWKIPPTAYNYTLTVKGSGSPGITYNFTVSNVSNCTYDSGNLHLRYYVVSTDLRVYCMNATDKSILHTVLAINYPLYDEGAYWYFYDYNSTEGNDSVVFNFKDKTNGNTLEGVHIDQYKLVAASWNLIDTAESDVTGRAMLYYNHETAYTFVSTKAGYKIKNFTLNPVLFSSYDVKLDPSYSFYDQYDDVRIDFGPFEYYQFKQNNFTFRVESVQGLIANHTIGYSLRYPCGEQSWEYDNIYGGLNWTIIPINCGSYGDSVNVTYWYVKNNGENVSFSYMFDIVYNASYSNFASLLYADYNINDFEASAIAVMLTMLLAGIAGMFGGAGIAVMAGLLGLGLLVAVHLLSLWYAIIPFIVGVIYLMGHRD